MNNLLIQINAERFKLKANNESPSVVNLTVEQGFQLLHEFNEQMVINHDPKEIADILIKMDEERMIDFFNVGARVYGLKININRLVE